MSTSPVGVRGGALAIGVHAVIISFGLRSTKRPGEPTHPVTIPVIYSSPTTGRTASGGGFTVQAPGPITVTVPTLPSTFDPGPLQPPTFSPTTGPIAPWSSPGRDSLPYVSDVVDQIPEILSSPPPRYPELLRLAHIEGVVVVEGVVDTLGHLEKGTLRIISSPHPALSTSAEECLEGAVFRPGRVDGRAVRVLIQIPVRYSMARR